MNLNKGGGTRRRPKTAAARTTAAVDKNKREGEAFLAANRSKPGVQTLPSGLQYKVLARRHRRRCPKASDTVVVKYRGTLDRRHGVRQQRASTATAR